MSSFILLNTIPCYYKRFENKEDAENFGFALQLLGLIEHRKYRYKIMDREPAFIENKRYNGYKLEEMSDEIYEKIIGELKNANFR